MAHFYPLLFTPPFLERANLRQGNTGTNRGCCPASLGETLTAG
jgi:hypothetical protein